MATLTRHSTFRSLKQETPTKTNKSLSPNTRKVAEVENFISQLRKKAKKTNKI